MSDFNNSLWRSYLDIDQEIRGLTPRMHSIPPARWNKLVDQHRAAAVAVREDIQFMNDLRERVDKIDDPQEFALIYEVLTGAVFENRSDIAAILIDPRVCDVSSQIIARPVVYLREAVGSEDPYSAEEEDDEWRDLSRLGGVPTVTPESPEVPDDLVFLAQVDCAALRREARHDEALAEAVPECVPRDGLMQLWHTTVGDSHTDPQRAGGGALLRYVDETDVRRRTSPGNIIESAYEAAPVSLVALPGFRTQDDADGRGFERVNLLQEEVYRVARNGHYSADYKKLFSINPFAATVGAVSRFCGLWL